MEKESYEYYKRALETGEYIAYLVYDNGAFVGAGGVSFYQVMSTYHNPTGKNVYYEYVYGTGISETGDCNSHIGFAGKGCKETGRITDCFRDDRDGTTVI